MLMTPSLVVGLSMGLSVSLTVALWRGVLGGRAAAEFVRTPKTGGLPQEPPSQPPAQPPAQPTSADPRARLGVAGKQAKGVDRRRVAMRQQHGALGAVAEALDVGGGAAGLGVQDL